MIILLDLKLQGQDNIHWEEYENKVAVSSPGLFTVGYDMRMLYMPKGTAYITKYNHTIINVLRGRLQTPELQAREANSYQKRMMLEAREDTLLFLCYDEKTSSKRMKGPINGLNLQWIEIASGCFHTDPKILVEGYRINLWYLVPNQNGSVHNHANQQDNNSAEQMVEFHTQLRGSGWMVKYREQNKKNEYERINMNVGKSHPLFCTVNGNGDVTYPLHAYIAGEEGALFVAFEDLKFDDLKKKS